MTLEELRKMVAEGVTTKELDSFARSWIESHGGKPAFLGYMNYPASLCVSLNNEVIHGIPGSRRLRAGDVVSLDLGVDLNGYFSDAAITVPVGATSRRRERLIEVTRECLARGVAQAVAGNRISDISRAIYEHATASSFGVVREYCGHGTGFAMHEDPQIPNYVGGGPDPREGRDGARHRADDQCRDRGHRAAGGRVDGGDRGRGGFGAFRAHGRRAPGSDGNPHSFPLE